MESNRYLNYFVVNGKKYYTGTVFIIKEGNCKPVEAVFICYDTQYNKYVYKHQDNLYCRHRLDAKKFAQWFVRLTGSVNNKVRMPRLVCLKDSQINGLPLGWLWYIVLMLFGTIFVGRIIWWSAVSVIFFRWRQQKIEKEGQIYEW